VQTASTCRRLQRFFQHVRLDEGWALPLLVRLLGQHGSWLLALDRTNWQIGKTEVNFPVLALVTRRFRVPLIWTVIKGRGCSDTGQRIALMKRYLAHFPAKTIRLLLADREFAGAGWMEFLCENNIPFAIRIRDNLRITTEEGHDPTLRVRLRQARRSRVFRARLGSREDTASGNAPLLTIAAKPLRDDWLIVVTNVEAQTALRTYRKRWAIECLFGDAKTRGLNIEATRLTDPRKPDLLMSLTALAIAWAGRSAADKLGKHTPPRKSHGHYSKSYFRIGLDQIRNRLRTDPLDAIRPWRRITQKRQKVTGAV
jgi:hypothetical protein